MHTHTWAVMNMPLKGRDETEIFKIIFQPKKLRENRKLYKLPVQQTESFNLYKICIQILKEC